MTTQYICRRVADVTEHFGPDWQAGVVLYDDTQAAFPCPCDTPQCIVVVRIAHGKVFGQAANSHMWTFSDDNGLPTFSPSLNLIGYGCKSHFFIRGGQVQWA